MNSINNQTQIELLSAIDFPQEQLTKRRTHKAQDTELCARIAISDPFQNARKIERSTEESYINMHVFMYDDFQNAQAIEAVTERNHRDALLTAHTAIENWLHGSYGNATHNPLDILPKTDNYTYTDTADISAERVACESQPSHSYRVFSRAKYRHMLTSVCGVFGC